MGSLCTTRLDNLLLLNLSNCVCSCPSFNCSIATLTGQVSSVCSLVASLPLSWSTLGLPLPALLQGLLKPEFPFFDYNLLLNYIALPGPSSIIPLWSVADSFVSRALYSCWRSASVLWLRYLFSKQPTTTLHPGKLRSALLNHVENRGF